MERFLVLLLIYGLGGFGRGLIRYDTFGVRSLELKEKDSDELKNNQAYGQSHSHHYAGYDFHRE